MPPHPACINQTPTVLPGLQLHPQLLNDCHILGKLKACYLLLNKNAALPWYILVPETDSASLFDLPSDQREQIMDECTRIAGWIKQHHGISRINFGVIGNIVQQLHLHVIGRHENDACWPRPVWGNLDTTQEYTSEELTIIKSQLVSEYQLAADEDPGC